MLSFGEGDWWIKSESDPRWNCNGHCEIVSGLFPPQELEKRLEKLEKEFGSPPDDLIVRWNKNW